MFGIKKMKAEIADLQAFEKGVCKIIEGYFKTNSQAEVRYSMDNGVDKFWHFVKSVDDRISKFEKALADGELVSKEWHDEQVGHLQAEIERLTEENGYLDGCAKQFLADYQKEQVRVDEQQAIINAQEKEINELRNPKTEAAKGGKK